MTLSLKRDHAVLSKFSSSILLIDVVLHLLYIMCSVRSAYQVQKPFGDLVLVYVPFVVMSKKQAAGLSFEVPTLNASFGIVCLPIHNHEFSSINPAICTIALGDYPLPGNAVHLQLVFTDGSATMVYAVAGQISISNTPTAGGRLIAESLDAEWTVFVKPAGTMPEPAVIIHDTRGHERGTNILAVQCAFSAPFALHQCENKTRDKSGLCWRHRASHA
jgi:hypothetical protein